MTKKPLVVLITCLSVLLLFCACAQKPDLTAEKGEYTIVQMTDTQFYAKNNPEYYQAMTRFIADNAEKINLAYIVHTGDIVQDALTEEQWQNADAAMQLLDGLPIGVLAGNHDTQNGDDRYAIFSRWFGEARYKDKPFYGAGYADNRAHYDLITAGGRDFVIVCIGDEPNQDCISFANLVFASYPEWTGILCTHQYLGEDSDLSSMGEYLQKNIVADNPNVRLVLCGHIDGFKYFPADFDDDEDGTIDRSVAAISANFQAADEAAKGALTFYKINEENSELIIQTYSAVTGAFIEEGCLTVALPW
ncbi:MAG: metallophosphoesterase [Clostridia bacterium]|nr:metallophosphoesterase [Clostridia bacterium]